jgi:hypothetical protein
VLRIRRRDHQGYEGLMNVRVGICILTLFFLSTAVFSYGQKTTEKMADSAVWLAPPSLKGLLTVYRANIIEGVKETLDSEADSKDIDLYKKLEEEMALLPKLAAKQSSFEQIAYHFGKIAAFVFILDDPFRIGEDTQVNDISADYKEYIDRKISKHILTFDGYSTPAFETPVSVYFEKRKTRFPRYIQSVLYCYYPSGERVSSSTFDDRSNAFGVAQIIVSRTISDTAKIWFHIWKAMDGDIEGTPFLKERGKKK